MGVILNKINHFSDYFISRIATSINHQKYLSIQLDITNSCNLICTHCYHSNHLNAGALKIEDWLNILNQYENLLKKLHLQPSFIICGGEPFTSPLLKPLIKAINEKWNDVQITILTNGTIYRESDVKFLKDYNIYLQISIDGHNTQTHDEKRGKGTFEKTIANIQKLIADNFEVHCLSILSKKTSLHISDYFYLAKKLNIKSMNFTRFIHQGFGERLYKLGEDRPLFPLELKSAMELIIESSKKSGIKTNTDQPLYYLLDPKLGQPGLFGFQGVIVDYKGNLKISSRADYKIGNIVREGSEKGLGNLFLKDALLNKLRSNKIQGCGDCKFYSKCGGDRNASFAATGSFLNVDPGCWYYVEKNHNNKLDSNFNNKIDSYQIDKDIDKVDANKLRVIYEKAN